ncbi:hypothetical protein [Rubidibacter lacunae]|uniref:hypothetical protein n=1 Tax=Rubidibacter lacunae TaxID=582514 RepID=UPI001E52629E|nr:hypothetical protein [Rubidibacter lacunae]
MALPSLAEGYCWLPSPAALSCRGTGRPPGQTKLEATLRASGVLQRNEVINPAFLSTCYGLPESFLDPSDSRAAVELCAISAWQPETYWTRAWLRSPSGGSNTGTISQKKPASGSLYKFLQHKTDIAGRVQRDPRIASERDRNPKEPDHWF